MPEQVSATDAAELRRLVQRFIRRVGVLAEGRTAYGQRISISHAYVLVFLAEEQRNRRAPSQRDLTLALGIDKSNVARLCAKLEREGHIVQRAARDDLRRRMITLTPAGRRLAESVERSSSQRFDSLLARIEPANRSAVLEALRVLTDALSSEQTRWAAPCA